MNSDISIESNITVITLVLEASLAVKIVLAILVLASIASWWVIIEKRWMLKSAVTDADDFEATFWSGIDLASFFRQVAESRRTAYGMAGIFQAGYREFARLRQEAGLTTHALVQSAQRAMNVSKAREIDRLEQSLAFLATVASTSPYVGLFGTVWGIMRAFYGLAGVKSATIDVVAIPISEALIATALGLFAAIPAQIAYNRYADKVDRLQVRYDTFTEELTSILERSGGRRPAQAGAGASAATSAHAGGAT
jgi:biopolymer transport protein TolQ